MRLRSFLFLSTTAVIGSLLIPTETTSAAPKLGARCSADQWGIELSPYICVMTGKARYVVAQLPSEPPLDSTPTPLATPPKLGGVCKRADYGRNLGPYVCSRTGRALYVTALLPPAPPVPLAAPTPSSAVRPVETTFAAPQTTALQTALSQPAAPAETITAVASTVPITAPSTSPTPSARRFTNCTELNAVYPHGVGKTGATDQTSGKPVTTFTVDDALYDANKGSDRDGDGIACEKA